MLPQGAENSLVIIPFGVLDLLDTNADVRCVFAVTLDCMHCIYICVRMSSAFTVGGLFGTPIILDGLKQTSVPTK